MRLQNVAFPCKKALAELSGPVATTVVAATGAAAAAAAAALPQAKIRCAVGKCIEIYRFLLLSPFFLYGKPGAGVATLQQLLTLPLAA
jgi:hypothetical protein